MERKKMIIISDNFANPVSACGICALSMVKEFLSRGYDIWAMSIADKPYDVDLPAVHFHYSFVKETQFTTFARSRNNSRTIFKSIKWILLYALRLPYAFIRYPYGSKDLVNRLSNVIEDIVKDNKIDLLLSTFSPYESVVAGMIAKDKYNIPRAVSYHLDPLLIRKNNNLLIDGYKLFRAKRALKKEIQTFDCVLGQPSTKDLYYSSQINYVYFPLYKDSSDNKLGSFIFPNDAINISYVGTLDIDNRNPTYFFELMKKVYHRFIEEGVNLKVHIWGRIFNDRIIELIDSYSFILYHGMIEPQYVDYLLDKSNIVFNISNGLSYTAIPSKIFQLFSSNRPIINIVRHPQDFSRSLFELYPCVLNINEFDTDYEYCQDLYYFIKDHCKDNIRVDKSIYKLSSPSYICDIIENA